MPPGRDLPSLECFLAFLINFFVLLSLVALREARMTATLRFLKAFTMLLEVFLGTMTKRAFSPVFDL